MDLHVFSILIPPPTSLPIPSLFLKIEIVHVHFLVLLVPLPRASLVAQRLKRLPAMQETWVRSLRQEDPLEKEMATHSSTLAWKIPWTEEPGRF